VKKLFRELERVMYDDFDFFELLKILPLNN